VELGLLVGWTDGNAEGAADGEPLGLVVEDALGAADGDAEGFELGLLVGWADGVEVGSLDGCSDKDVPERDWSFEGC